MIEIIRDVLKPLEKAMKFTSGEGGNSGILGDAIFQNMLQANVVEKKWFKYAGRRCYRHGESAPFVNVYRICVECMPIVF